MAHRVLAIVTDGLEGDEPIEEIRRHGEDVELRVVVPAVEATAFRHTLGDVDEPRQEAEERLERLLGRSRDGLEADRGGRRPRPDAGRPGRAARRRRPTRS